MNELFNSTHDALTFAFNYSSQQYALSPMSKLSLKGAGIGKGLISVDGAGQAGFIMAAVNRLTPVHKCCIVARYAIKTTECHCCGSEAMTDQYGEAILNLMEFCIKGGHITGVSVRKLRELIVRSFYERGISIQQAAEKYKVQRSTAYDQKTKIWTWLKNVDAQAGEQVADAIKHLVEGACKK